MTIQSAQFTPEVLLAAPRRSAGLPNSTGEKVLFTVTTYSFEEHKTTSQIRVLDVKTAQSTLLYEDPTYSEPTWVGENEFVFVKSGDKGVSSLMLADATKPGLQPKEIRSFGGAIANIKFSKLDDDTLIMACSALAEPSGEMANPETESKPHATGKAYSSLFVRHWDYWKTKHQSTIWFGRLKKEKDGGMFAMQEPGLVNALAGTKLSSPVPPFGGVEDFDISRSGLAFIAKDPELCPATYTKTDVYYIPLETLTEAKPPAPLLIKTGALLGYAASVTFSPDGKQLAFTKMRSKQYESDKPRLMLVPDVSDLGNVQEFYQTEDGEGAWDVNPAGIMWSHDGKELFVTAEDCARVKIFKLPSSPALAKDLPQALTSAGAVNDMRRLATGSSKLFITSSSIVDSSCYSILDPATKELDVVSSPTKHGETLGLSPSQFDETWFQGAGEYRVHALIVKPSNFDPSKKYPLAVIVHGGPQSAWLDRWNTRWNPAVFAEQGYILVAPNPTGSTGYGMALQDGITDEWGGRPYNDLVNCLEHIETTMPYVDTQRAVAMGASYGGFMINWIQGHPLGRKFKALVCHDGIFSTLNQWSTEELFFPMHDFKGSLAQNRAGYEKWDPARHIANWATPQLIIHNELDYRIPISEGLAPFNVLQNNGVPSRFLMFPDENHFVLKPENSKVWHEEVLGWINKYSGVDKTAELAHR